MTHETIKPEVLKELRSLGASVGQDLLANLVVQFLEQMAVDLPRLADAVEKHDLHRAGHVAHKLKGSAATLGAQHFPEVCLVLEEMSRQPVVEKAHLARAHAAVQAGAAELEAALKVAAQES